MIKCIWNLLHKLFVPVTNHYLNFKHIKVIKWCTAMETVIPKHLIQVAFFYEFYSCCITNYSVRQHIQYRNYLIYN